MKRLELDGEETAEPQSMTSATKRERMLHHRGNLISSNQLADARQPQADADRQARVKSSQRFIAEGLSPDEALKAVNKRWKWEERNRWSVIWRSTRCHLPESQVN